MICSIYALIDDNNNIFYIGASIDPERRYKQHLMEAKHYLKIGEKLWVTDKMRKIANIIANGNIPTILILEYCNINDAKERERFYYNCIYKIQLLLQINPKKGGGYSYLITKKKLNKLKVI